MKLPSAAERTCLRTRDVPALNIATVASAIGLPPSSRTTPLITAKVPLRSAVAVGRGRAEADPADAATSTSTSSFMIFPERLKPIKSNASEQKTSRRNLDRSWRQDG